MIRFIVSLAFGIFAVLGQDPYLLTVNGKQIDPCAIPSLPNTGIWPDPQELKCRPGEGQTIYIPRVGDAIYAPIPNPIVLPVTGANFAGLPVAAFCLGRYDRVNHVSLPCSAGCDNAFNEYPNAAFANTNLPISTTGTISIPTQPAGVALAWNDNGLIVERESRRVCMLVGGAPRYAGFRIAINQHCGSNANCVTHIANNLIDSGRTTCCTSAFTLPGAPGGNTRVGVCINPNIYSCCGGIPITTSTAKCCNAGTEIVENYQTPCPCQRVLNGPNGCPISEPNCCLTTKYPELSVIAVPAFGQCFDGIRFKCCNTGQRFDPGTFQCCSINGLQSLNDPCPCQADQDCQGGIVGEPLLPLKCCRQIWPNPMESASCNAYNNYPALDIFTTRNADALTGFVGPVATLPPGVSGVTIEGTFLAFAGPNVPPIGLPVNVPLAVPSRINDLISRRDLGNWIGRGVKETQRCNGVCYDTSYQICCNGVTCVREYEKCCNSTCCNRFVGTCAEAYRAGTPNNRFNYIGYGNRFEQCSTIEQISILRAWWIFVLPTKLLALTLIALAFVLVFANRGTTRSHSLIERALIITGVLVVFFALPNFFSPAYKYGIVMVIVGLVGILCAAERTKWLNILAIIAIIIGLLYLFDPFHGGNDVLSFSSFRFTDNGVRDDESSGILHFIGNKAWRNLTTVNSKDNFCVQYYDYFRLDPQLRDLRFENPLVTTFGYCGRGWITALLIFEAILCFFAILLLVLALIAFFLRFAVESFEPIEIALEQNFIGSAGPLPFY